MSTSADNRRAAAVRGADAKRESAPDDYWRDDIARREAARIRARIGMNYLDYFQILLELAASDEQARRDMRDLNDCIDGAISYSLEADRIIAAAARSLITSIRIVAAQNEYEELER